MRRACEIRGDWWRSVGRSEEMGGGRLRRACEIRGDWWRLVVLMWHSVAVGGSHLRELEEEVGVGAVAERALLVQKRQQAGRWAAAVEQRDAPSESGGGGDRWRSVEIGGDCGEIGGRGRLRGHLRGLVEGEIG